jgi:hybrid polyketide synthase/nonribosomal peptide synthetase ACE1
LKDGYGSSLTYKEMDNRVESISYALRRQLPGDGTPPIVGVFQMPSADWMCSLLAIQRIGAIYMPLDLRNGTPRLKSNVEAAQPSALLTDAETANQVHEICDDKSMITINVSKLPACSEQPKLATAALPDNAAYIIFTSGSTGKPKGIVVKHAGLSTNLEGYHTEWSVGTMADVVLQQTALSFDASLVQIFAALTTGGCLFVVPADARGDPAEVTRLMVANKVTMTQATPSEYDMWFRFAPETLHQCSSWKAAWFGGERAGPSVLDGFRKACKAIPDLQVFTSYGPTESTISAMKGEADVRNHDLRVPVPGRPLPNYAVYIVDDAMQPVPNGVPGEIVIGGAGVGHNEYLNQKELTAKSFIQDTFTTPSDNGWGKMYRTGDYGRLNAKGYLTVEGRIAGDTQVKLRGFRIELAEIESVMVKESSGAISDAVVTLRGDNEHDGFLVAHVVVKSKANSDSEMAEVVDKLRARLPLCLPQYMCPAVIVPLEKLPLTSHHKVDRKALQASELPKLETAMTEQARTLTATELRLVDLWKNLLPPSNGTTGLGPRSDFFRSGGNSLLLVKLQAAMRREFHDAPRLSKLMSAPELGSMAALLDDGASSVDWDKEIELAGQDKLQWREKSSSVTKGLSILLTGATGSLGRRIIPRLANDDRVSRIVCLVRPVDGRDMEKAFTNTSDKVQIMSANLPSLPADDDISDVDIVLHCAADRNFWDGYHAVKSVNVDTAKALARFCLRSGASLHVMSSGVLSEYESEANSSLPRPNAGDGYMSSKWVAERYLSRVAQETGLRVTMHRPTETSKEGVGLDCMAKTEAAVAESMLTLSKELGVRPDFANFGGIIDLTSVDSVADSVSYSTVSTSAHSNFKIITHAGTERMRTDALAIYAEEMFARTENSAQRSLPTVSVLHWVGLAKRAGLFEWFFTAQNLIVEDENGNKIVSRR